MISNPDVKVPKDKILTKGTYRTTYEVEKKQEFCLVYVKAPLHSLISVEPCLGIV